MASLGASVLKLKFYVINWNSMIVLFSGEHCLIEGDGCKYVYTYLINPSPPGQNGRHFADNIFRCIFMNEKFYVLIKISLRFVSWCPIDNNPASI